MIFTRLANPQVTNLN